MKYFLILLSLFLSSSSIAQNKTIRKPKKNNIKISLINFRAFEFQNTFYTGFRNLFENNHTQQSFGLQYECAIRGRLKFVVTPSYDRSKYIYRGTIFSDSRTYGLGLGYRYNFLRFKKNDFFNGVYAGINFFNWSTFSKDRKPNELIEKSYSHSIGGDFELGTQTILFRRLSLQLSCSYRITRLIYPYIFIPSRASFLSSISIGYTF